MHFICWDVLVLMFLEGKPLPSVSQRAKQILVVGTTLHFCCSLQYVTSLSIGTHVFKSHFGILSLTDSYQQKHGRFGL